MLLLPQKCTLFLGAELSIWGPKFSSSDTYLLVRGAAAGTGWDPWLGKGDVNSGTCLGTDTAFPWGQETSASDSHMGLSVAVGWEAGTAGPPWVGIGALPNPGWLSAQERTLRVGVGKAV